MSVENKTEEISEPIEEEEAVEEGIAIEETDKKKSKKKKWIIVLCVIVGILLIAAIAIIIGGNYFLNRINYETVDDIEMAPSDLTEEELAKAVKVPKLKNDSNIINILLIGEEAMTDSGAEIESTQRGRSDVNIVLTINRKKKTVKLISFLRDTLVQIPGYRDDLLNSAYQKGGGPLLQDTLQLNFGVITDGYIRVRFSAFSEVIDALGGVEITLTESEAYCLNNTNYISKPKYRNVKVGKNHFNGNQALGYCRIRKGKYGKAVTSLKGHNNDWGRVERQKNVLESIFQAYKTKGITELIPLVNQLLPLATTNMEAEQLIAILSAVIDMNIKDIETLSLPMENEYTSGGGSALRVDYAKMSTKVYNFIHGIEDTDAVSSTAP